MLEESTGCTNISAEPVYVALQSMIEGASVVLKEVKKKDKTAVVISDMKGNFILAGVTEYTKNEEEGQDNWNYYWTFDKEDVKDAVCHDANEANIQTRMAQAMARHKVDINKSMVALTISTIARGLSDYLDENAKEGETFEIEYEDVFIATSEIDGGVIVKSLIPGGKMKKLIKDDAATEV